MFCFVRPSGLNFWLTRPASPLTIRGLALFFALISVLCLGAAACAAAPRQSTEIRAKNRARPRIVKGAAGRVNQKFKPDGLTKQNMPAYIGQAGCGGAHKCKRRALRGEFVALAYINPDSSAPPPCSSPGPSQASAS